MAILLTAGVAVDKATLDFDRIFTYAVPPQFESKVKKGSIAAVPFGRGNTVRIGIVLSVSETEDTGKLKYISDLKNEDAVITDYAMSLITYLKENTFCTWYEAVRTVIPYGALYKIKDGLLSKQLTRYTENYYRAKDGFDESLLKTEKQNLVFSLLKSGEYTEKEISRLTGTTKSVTEGLVKKGAVSVAEKDKTASAYRNIKKCKDEVNLSRRQQAVYREISDCNDSKPHLLHGVTSSGKSMIFIKLIKDVLESGGSAMVLVPEISLTPQMVRLLKEYFGDTVSVIHSRLSPTERLLQYNAALNGTARVAVGTRSAVFTPLQNLSLIIIDEEHEKTYKSESAPRYSAVRAARQISKMTGAKLLLSSATPSIESYYLAKSGYYHLHTLSQRYADMPLPTVEIIDMSRQTLAGDTGPVSSVVLKYIAESIAESKQSIVLINRRGYTTVGICKDCKKTLQCRQCSVNLVRHKHKNKLMCHYCGRTYPTTDTCPDCGGEIVYSGFGTQRIEEYIQRAIPSARILRMDADSTGRADSHEKMLEAFAKKEYDILIGTQMVAKGLDFEDVNLVCVLGIDAMINAPGYNSNEQAFNLITQVIGRRGRHSQNAKAVIQTYDAQNKIINMAAAQNYAEYFNEEISYRKLNLYPPYCTVVQVAFTHANETVCERDSRGYLEIMKAVSKEYGDKVPLVVLGPVPFDIALANGMYRYRLTIKCKNNALFREYLNRTIQCYLQDRDNKSSVYVNINPIRE